MIRVHSEVRVLEVNGEKIPAGHRVLLVESHWNSGKMVVLTLNDKRLTVGAADLQQAVTNARNSNSSSRVK